MLSNACFLAKFRFDTAENEPAKNLQNYFCKICQFCKNFEVRLLVTAAQAEAFAAKAAEAESFTKLKLSEDQRRQLLEERARLYVFSSSELERIFLTSKFSKITF